MVNNLINTLFYKNKNIKKNSDYKLFIKLIKKMTDFLKKSDVIMSILK